MKKIIGILKPFDMNQKFYVYQDGEQLEFLETTIDKLYQTIFDLAKKYEINQIDLNGPYQYTNGIIKNIQEKELLKYKKNILEFHII